MDLAILAIVQYLHVLAGIAWFGGYLFMAAAIWPILLKKPGKEASALFVGFGKGAGPLMAISGNLVFILGILRGTWLGPLKSFEMIHSTPYGRTWLAALILTLILMVHGGMTSRKIPDLLASSGQIKPELVKRIRIDNLVTILLFSLVVLCMVLMRLGL